MTLKEYARRIARAAGRFACKNGQHWWGAMRASPEFPYSDVLWSRQCIRPECGKWEHHP